MSMWKKIFNFRINLLKHTRIHVRVTKKKRQKVAAERTVSNNLFYFFFLLLFISAADIFVELSLSKPTEKNIYFIIINTTSC